MSETPSSTVATSVLYRYHDSQFTDDSVRVYLDEFPIVKRTPCGVWIDHYGTEKFVRNHAKKSFAYPTKEQALHSFVKRKEAQIRVCRGSIRRAERALHEVANGQTNDLIPTLSQRPETPK